MLTSVIQTGFSERNQACTNARNRWNPHQSVESIPKKMERIDRSDTADDKVFDPNSVVVLQGRQAGVKGHNEEYTDEPPPRMKRKIHSRENGSVYPRLFGKRVDAALTLAVFVSEKIR